MIPDSKELLQWALLFAAVVVMAITSWYVATQTYDTDFPILYRAGRLALLRDLPLDAVYDRSILSTIPVPEPATGVVEDSGFIWPSFAAVLLAALAWLPYYQAKALMVFLNAIGYVYAVSVFARGCGASASLRIRLVAIACLWPPFIDTLLFGQVNALLLLLAVLAARTGSQGRWLISGAAVALGSVLKLYPLALTGFLGLMDLRIGVAALGVFGLMMMHQPVAPWVASLSTPTVAHPSLPMLLLTPISPSLLITYVVGVLAAGLLVGWVGRRLGAEWLVALGLVTVLLASPMSEYYHLTLVIVAYVFLVLPGRSDWPGRVSALVSMLFLTVAWYLPSVPRLTLVWLGLLALWLGLGSQLRDLNRGGRGRAYHGIVRRVNAVSTGEVQRARLSRPS